MFDSISVVVPVFNEERNIAPLAAAVREALGDASQWELILVDDGSRDGTARIAMEEVRNDGRVRLVRLARNYGQSVAMQAGFDTAGGDVVVTMDGDLQNDPRDIPVLVSQLEEGFDLVAGYRVNRQDRLITRKVPSWIANRIIRWITRVDIRDNGCSLKAYRTDLLQRLHLYSDMHRFIPAIAAGTAGARITEVPVRHHARRFGESKYGLSRVGKVLADLLTIVMIRSFRLRPLRLFSYISLVVSLVGVLFLAGSVPAWLSVRGADHLIYPSAALLCFFLATFLLLLGLVAEVAVERIREDEDPEVLVREVA